jgi:hypothetical protein
MRNRLALLTLSFVGALFGTASCGQDEATGPTGAGYCQVCEHSSECASGTVCLGITDKPGLGACAKSNETKCCTNGSSGCRTLGAPIDGHSGGSGGSGGSIINSGGKAGKGGSGGTGGGVTKQTHLGQSCIKDADCGDENLQCIGSTGLSDGTGIPKGLCTMPCTDGNDCLDKYDNSFCFEFNKDDHYCIEGCTTGTLGSPKCHQRDEIACSLIGLLQRSTSCDTSADCGSQQLCDSDTGTCGDIVTGCVPLCAGDFDCGDKEYCDFETGMCTKTKPTGLPHGAVCTPPKGTAQDPCQGFCDAGTNPNQGICESLCVLSQSFAGCGWDGLTPDPDHVCLFGTILSPPGDAAIGDVGICGALCDCNDQCLREGDVCIDESGGDVEQIWGRRGYCRTLDTGEALKDTFRDCPAGVGGGAGNNGAGGESGGPSSGTGGSGGSGGSNTSGGEAGDTAVNTGGGGQGGG